MILGATSDRDEILERAAGCSVVGGEGNNDILKKMKSDCYKTAFNAYRFSWWRHVHGVGNFCGRIKRKTVIV